MSALQFREATKRTGISKRRLWLTTEDKERNKEEFGSGNPDTTCGTQMSLGSRTLEFRCSNYKWS